MRTLIYSLLCVTASYGADVKFDDPVAISMSIVSTGSVGDLGYTWGKPIMIRCSIKNEGDETCRLLLQDHHVYHGTLPYPTSMTASIWDEKGNVIVSDCSQYVVWNTTFPEMPGDRVFLKPGEEIVRIVPLEQIVTPFVKSLKNGIYRIQLKIPEAKSNIIIIRIIT